MNEATLNKILAELRDNLIGARFGKIFVLGRDRLAIDMRRENGNYLFISVNPTSPRIYLIERKLTDLSKIEGPTGNFAAMLRKRLSNSRLAEIRKPDGERVVELLFDAGDESIETSYTLVAQLTGRSSNLFLLDSDRIIIDFLRSAYGTGQKKHERYAVPPHPSPNSPKDDEEFDMAGFPTLSAALDAHDRDTERGERLNALTASARSLIRAEIKKKERLKTKLAADLANHGDPEEWKRLGDLLKANISTAAIDDGKAVVIDYFDNSLPSVEIEIGERHSISEAAEAYFKKYTKSKNAQIEIKKRVNLIAEELRDLEIRSAALEDAARTGDAELVERFLPASKKRAQKSDAASGVSKYAREFVSSDGLAILVGKRSKDNDYLTFRIAKSLDLWLHAEDYPGSHVIIKRLGRNEVPQSTIVEAAMLAAFYSKAKKETKAAVKFTERKYVNKQKGFAPGIVSISKSKTILVKPGIPDTLSK